MPVCLLIDTAVPREGPRSIAEAKLCHTNAITQLVRALRSIILNDDLRAIAFNGMYRNCTELSAATRDYDKLLSKISSLDLSWDNTCEVGDALSEVFQLHAQMNVPIGTPCHFVLVTADETLLEGKEGVADHSYGLPTYCELHLLLVRHHNTPTHKRGSDAIATAADSDQPTKRIKNEGGVIKNEYGTLAEVTGVTRGIAVSGKGTAQGKSAMKAPANGPSQLSKADGTIDISDMANPSALALLCRSVCGVSYATQMTPDLRGTMKALADSCYTPFSGHLAMGHLTDSISLYPTPPKYTLRLGSSAEMRPLPDVLSIVGFVDNLVVRPLPILSRHVILGPRSEESDSSFRLMLYDALIANSLSAVVELSREWFGVISCQKDFYNKDETNLVLLVIKPHGEIIWRMEDSGKVLLDSDPPLHLERPSSTAKTQESSFGSHNNGLVWMYPQTIESHLSKLTRNLQSINDRKERLKPLMAKINATIAVYHLTSLKVKVLEMLERKAQDTSISEASLAVLNTLIGEMVT